MPNNQGLKVYQLKLKSKDDTLTLTLIILVDITKPHPIMLLTATDIPH